MSIGSIRDEGRGVGVAPPPGTPGGIPDAMWPDDRARANLALLYGGAGLGPVGRVVIEAPGRARGLGMAVGGATARC